MGMNVKQLRSACNALRDHLKIQHDNAQFQELQMMGLYDQYFIAANYRHASRFISTDPTVTLPLLNLGGRVNNIVRANNAEDAANKNGQKQLIIIDGASSAGNIIHAEQTLLLVLAYKLKNNMTPCNVSVAGCKVACTKCYSVLEKFAVAYKSEYRKILSYEENRFGAYGTNGNADIKAINFKEHFSDVEDQVSYFADFIAGME